MSFLEDTIVARLPKIGNQYLLPATGDDREAIVRYVADQAKRARKSVADTARMFVSLSGDELRSAQPGADEEEVAPPTDAVQRVVEGAAAALQKPSFPTIQSAGVLGLGVASAAEPQRVVRRGGGGGGGGDDDGGDDDGGGAGRAGPAWEGDEAELRRVLDFNGDDSADPDELAFGYIEPWERLPITADVQAVLRNGDTVPITLQMAKDLWQLSRERLTGHQLSDNDVNVLIALRINLIAQGFLYRSKRDRCVLVDEVDVVTVNRGAFKQEEFAAWAKRYDWVKKFVAVIAGMVAFVFRNRGHHWTEALDGLYQRVWAACVVKLAADQQLPSWRTISRTGLHAFGVRALEDLWRVRANANKVPRALVIRRDSGPAGAAVITSAAAAIRASASETWFPYFLGKFYGVVLNILGTDELIKRNPLSYHINARLYGMQKTDIDESLVAPVAPYLQAFIESLPEASPVRQIQALRKRASNNAAIVETFRELFLNLRAKAAEAISHAQLLSAFTVAEEETRDLNIAEVLAGRAAPRVAGRNLGEGRAPLPAPPAQPGRA